MNKMNRSFVIFISTLGGLILGYFIFSEQPAQQQRNFPQPLHQQPQHVHNKTKDQKKIYTYPVCIMSKVKSLSEFNSCNFVEWMEYHLLMGVSHFYINNDCSPEPSFSKALNYYKQLGVLTIPNENITVNCVNHKPNEELLIGSTFKKYSSLCEWVSVLDMDEYITLHDKPTYVSADKPDAVAFPEQHKVLSTLHELLAASQFPFVRLPWWVIGSDGLEKRPKGLTISNYHKGRLQRMHIKSIAKTSEIQEWYSQLYPFPKNPQGILFGNVTREEYVQRGHLMDHEYMTVTVKKNNSSSGGSGNSDINQEQYYPLSNIFIKHYVYLSWEELILQRAAHNVTAAGGKNIFKEDPRAFWLSSGHKMYGYIAERFTAEMAAKVMGAIRQRVIHAKTVKSSVFDSCSKYWF